MSGFSASPAQRKKVAELPCIVTGRYGADPAHLLSRAQGGCDDPACVVPLERAAHRSFDQGGFDLLPYLVQSGCFEEMAHVIAAHRVSPVRLVRRLTGNQREAG